MTGVHRHLGRFWSPVKPRAYPQLVEALKVDTRPITEEELAEARRYSMFVQWSPEDGVWTATVSELGNAKTHGRTPTEAVEMGAEMVAAYLGMRRRRGEPVPEPSLFSTGAVKAPIGAAVRY